MNKIFLLGNITREPDYTEKTSEDGRSDSIVKFDVAVGRRQKKEGGPESDFFHCTAFGKKADFISKYFKKGSKILVEGHVQNNNYTNKNGEKVYGFNVLVEEVEFAQKKSKDNDADDNSDL